MLDLIFNFNHYFLFFTSIFLVAVIFDLQTNNRYYFLGEPLLYAILLNLSIQIGSILFNLGLKSEFISIFSIFVSLTYLITQQVFWKIRKLNFITPRGLYPRYFMLYVALIILIDFIDNYAPFYTTGDSWAIYETATYLEKGQVTLVPKQLVYEWGLGIPFIVSLAQKNAGIFSPSFNIITLISGLTILICQIKLHSTQYTSSLTNFKIKLFAIVIAMLIIFTQYNFLIQSVYLNRHLLVAVTYLNLTIILVKSFSKGQSNRYFVYLAILPNFFVLASLRLDAALVALLFMYLAVLFIPDVTLGQVHLAVISTFIVCLYLSTISFLPDPDLEYFSRATDSLLKILIGLMIIPPILYLNYYLTNKLDSKFYIYMTYFLVVMIPSLLLIYSLISANPPDCPVEITKEFDNADVNFLTCTLDTVQVFNRILKITLSYSGFSLIFTSMIVFSAFINLTKSPLILDRLVFIFVFAHFILFTLIGVYFKYYVALNPYPSGSFSRSLFHLFFILVLQNSIYVSKLLKNIDKRVC